MRFLLLILTILVLSHAANAADAAPQPGKSTDIIPYLDRIVDWNRYVVSAEQLMDKPREAVLGDKLHQDAETVSQKGFEYARAAAAMAPTDQNADTASRAQNSHDRLLKKLADVTSQVATLQAQLNKSGQNQQLAGQLKLAEARQALLQAMVGIAGSENDGTLLDQINILSRTAQAEFPSQSKSPVSDALQAKTSPASYGIFDLSKALVTASEKQNAIDGLLLRTQKINDTTHELIDTTRAGLKDALSQGDALTVANGQTADAATYQKSVDALVAHYKQLSAVLIPLGESNASLENVQQNLKEWKKMTLESEDRITHQLLLRLAILIITVAVPLIGSSVAHRVIFRLKDIQKRKRLDLIRRVLVIIALIIVILANFLTEFGSLATFAGFATAGLAVGLQTVLVSMVAHSFYFGRYGIHVGDRIRIGDVTGEVMQMGILRLYMRELKETDKGLVPTGKIVAFPNSVMFQPSALYKYADGEEIRG